MKKRFNIKVMGQDFSVLSDRGEEHVADVVQYVNDKAKDIGSASKDISTLGIAILVALNVADELFRLKEEREDFYSLLERRSEKLINYIEKKT
ncbi:MAG TPA: cell division protein ZapA [Deltaproteobacteria bacterium]|nr:cell division protein ZapA [Deltaproteobacteria bacterium]